MRLKTLLGDYPVTRALKSGEIAGGAIELEFADVKLPQSAFKRVVRNLEFDVAELALVTYLLAKAEGKPYRLLPAVLTARFQHPFLCYNAERGPLSPEKLEGKRVGQRSYSVTTATWLRGVLAEDHGVDLSKVRWVTFEEPHVAEFRDPPNVARVPAGKDMAGMLLSGELDAAILGELPKDPRLRSLIPDPEAAARAWCARTGANIQINHMVVVRDSIASPLKNKIYESFVMSKKAAGNPVTNPFGIEENRRNLEAAIDCVHRQGMIPRRFSVEELFA
ncbi:MAG TPA: phosphate ABC transporter substrate-binding protein [Burkholderiales bacterium]|nr:phosphate ABC transporter substrate-binding protein [Burkholderiales bacterium]